MDTEAVPVIFGILESISVAEETLVVRNLHGGEVAGLDEIWPEMLKLLDKVGLVLSGVVYLNWQTGKVVLIYGVSSYIDTTLYARVLWRRLKLT